jgi:hypothetical protein
MRMHLTVYIRSLKYRKGKRFFIRNQYIPFLLPDHFSNRSIREGRKQTSYGANLFYEISSVIAHAEF